MPIHIGGTVRCGAENCGAETTIAVSQPTDAGNAVDIATGALQAALAGWQTSGAVRCPGCAHRPRESGVTATVGGGDGPSQKHGVRRGLATAAQP